MLYVLDGTITVTSSERIPMAVNLPPYGLVDDDSYQVECRELT